MLFLKGKYEFLIAGLGNPGPGFVGTRHNAGFEAADYIIKKAGLTPKKRFDSFLFELMLENKKCILIKPQTFMNNSGLAVRNCASFYRIPVEKIIVIHDDITVAPGKFKIKSGGSDGGHNGLKSISQELGSYDYIHIKLGIGPKPYKDQPLADFVTKQIPENEKQLLKARLEDVYDAVKMIAAGQTDQAKAKYNHDPKPVKNAGEPEDE